MTRAKARRYPVPEGYPIPASQIPDMPAETFHLLHTGALMAADCDRWGWRAMRCADCETERLDMIYRHGPLPLSAFRKGVLPGTAWGKDVTPICPCCSFGLKRASTPQPAPQAPLSPKSPGGGR